MANEPRIIFLGGIFLPEHLGEIEKQSSGVLQNAADALQKAFLRGFAETTDQRVKVVNLPFVNSYPRWYRSAWLPSQSGSLAPGIDVVGQSFLNVLLVRLFSRFVSAVAGLRKSTRREEQIVIVVYSAHLPFVAAAWAIRHIRPNARLCVIIPDLPEFMGDGGRLYRALKWVETGLFKRFVRRFDYFVLLAEAMGTRLEIPTERCVLVEGIYDPAADGSGEDVKEEAPRRLEDTGPVFLYTGTLAARYGIGDLLDAFAALDRPDAQLWICGDGDARSTVEAMADSDKRVRYFGQVPRSRALELQKQADILVNPRKPEGEFTRYSFPSKTMEYLASGKVTIMHALPAMPPDYADYILVPNVPNADGLAAAMRKAADMSVDEREGRGAAGRAFVREQKTPAAQVQRVLLLWNSGSHTGSTDA